MRVSQHLTENDNGNHVFTPKSKYMVASEQKLKGSDILRKLIKHKMLDLNREDFVTYLSELLEITRQAASSKLKGDSGFTEKEIAILTLKLGFTADELKNAIIKDETVESDRMCEATE